MHLLLAATLLVSAQDSARWAPLARVIDSALASRAFPGAVVAVGRHDSVLYLKAFGHLEYESREPVQTSTIYDIASLTKVVGLTTAMMQLVAQQRVELDSPAARYVPPFHDRSVTVRQLLTHSSGLPAFKQWWTRVHSRDDMFALADAEPLEAPPGTRMVYSDIGALVMTQIVEYVSGEKLDAWLDARLFRPLGMADTRFNPPPSLLPRIAPTEMDNNWRHGMVRGQVHDENAASMGGVSGHAGMFSTAPDLARFAQMMLGCFAVAPRTSHGSSDARRTTHDARVVDCETVRMFTTVQQPGFSSRALGWDTPSGTSSAGSLMSAQAFGHTGFTGTSMWMDPAQDLFVILLTNRVHPTRENTQIFAVRRAVADAAVAASRR